MSMNPATKKEARDKAPPSNGRVAMGQHWSFNICNDPKRLAFVLSRYKFAARLATKGKRVLELGCSEGLGGRLLADQAVSYTGIDLDEEAVAAARRNLTDPKYTFFDGDCLGRKLGTFDTVVSMDVIEHIEQPIEHRYFETCYDNLDEDGVCIIGTPNITSAPYASKASQEGHVNLFDGKRLKTTLQKYFHNVFLFGLNDEVVHTGYTPMAHFLMAVGVYKRREVVR